MAFQVLEIIVLRSFLHFDDHVVVGREVELQPIGNAAFAEPVTPLDRTLPTVAVHDAEVGVRDGESQQDRCGGILEKDPCTVLLVAVERYT